MYITVDRISESHQAGEFEVKNSLFPLRQPYTRMRDTLRGINRGIPMRTNNIVSANLPNFETFMENLPTMGKWQVAGRGYRVSLQGEVTG